MRRDARVSPGEQRTATAKLLLKRAGGSGGSDGTARGRQKWGRDDSQPPANKKRESRPRATFREPSGIAPDAVPVCMCGAAGATVDSTPRNPPAFNNSNNKVNEDSGRYLSDASCVRVLMFAH